MEVEQRHFHCRGKNLTFYVALEDISKGDELLMDYGLLYQPVPDIAVKQDPGR